MELNGVANMLAIIDMAVEDGSVKPEAAAQLKDQLDVMERYMCAVRASQIAKSKVPFWHEVRDNRTEYPNNRGK